MSEMNRYEQEMDRFDSFVFTGDVMWQDEEFKLLEYYVNRWKKAVEDHRANIESEAKDE